MEPAGVQLDRQEGDPIRESQPDHTVWQVPSVLPGNHQVKVVQLPVASRYQIIFLSSHPVWRRMFWCDLTRGRTVYQWAEKTNRGWLRRTGRRPAFFCTGALASCNTSNTTVTGADTKNRKQRRKSEWHSTVPHRYSGIHLSSAFLGGNVIFCFVKRSFIFFSVENVWHISK